MTAFFFNGYRIETFFKKVRNDWIPMLRERIKMTRGQEVINIMFGFGET